MRVEGMWVRAERRRFRVQGFELSVEGKGFRVYISGFGGLGFRVLGLGFRV
jgi:hypothetical protein